MMFSVVICTHNPREEYFRRVVGSIAHLKPCSGKHEVLVVDNNSERPVKDMSVLRESPVRVVVERRPGLTAALECAVMNAAGDIIVFIDDDNVADPGYLIVAEKVFQDPKIGIMSGEVIPEYEAQPGRWFKRFEAPLGIRRLPSDMLFVTSVPLYSEFYPVGAGMCIRRSILAEYFSTTSGAERIEGRKGKSLSSGEDLDLDLFAIRQGFLIGCTRELKLTHLIPPFRTTVEYLIRLTRSSMVSIKQVNDKWRGVFGVNAFTIFEIGWPTLIAKLSMSLLLYPVRRFRIRFHGYVQMLKLIANDRRGLPTSS